MHIYIRWLRLVCFPSTIYAKHYVESNVWAVATTEISLIIQSPDSTHKHTMVETCVPSVKPSFDGITCLIVRRPLRDECHTHWLSQRKHLPLLTRELGIHLLTCSSTKPIPPPWFSSLNEKQSNYRYYLRTDRVRVNRKQPVRRKGAILPSTMRSVMRWDRYHGDKQARHNKAHLGQCNRALS